MNNRGVRNLFIYGTIFFFVIFIVLTVDTMRQVDQRSPVITPEVNAGKQVWHKYDCIGCHTILGNGSYFAPDMTKTAERKPRGYLQKFLMDPKAVNAKATMPKLGLTADEADKLITFLEWISKVDTNGWPPDPILAAAAGAAGRELSPGQLLYQSQGCAACHSISGIGGTSGPDLTRVGAGVKDIAWHVRHLKDPQSVVPGSAMPGFGHLSEADLKDLSAYLMKLK